ncbi:DUF3618 domain-containing protein [Frateuria hangzhouensis]|uniref:DUF3618 domain-containing protein n=1 Tax=Frateuria hangzhouensis TaxID=2995589 RepID=UPI002260D3A9|nr:DUF3618 domain-containing protein [Frateuria sp. STR12]MCX7515134.1 DUF3618 domain-containing protein [Frateuria sp. STR12]
MNTADRIEAESHKDPARLEREIDQQRADINHIVDALENKLSPGQLFDRLLHYGKGNGREVAQNIGNAVKANPVPALLTSVGLLWLYASRNDPAPMPGTGRDAYTGAGAGDGEGMMDRARELGEEVSDGVSSTWNQARSRVSGTASRMADSAHGARDSLMHQKDRAVQGYNHLLHDNPLALGAIGIAVGALLGAALPTTEPENRLMGEASDDLADKARDAMHTGAEKARDVMHDVGEPKDQVRH